MRPSQIRRLTLLSGFTLAVVVAIVAFVLTQKSPLEEGMEAFEEGDYGKAVAALERAAKTRKDDLSLLRTLAKAYELIKQYDRAAATYESASRLFPEEPDLVRSYGEMLVLDGEKDTPPFERAETFAREFIQQEENSTNPVGYFILGKALVHRYNLLWKTFEKETQTEYDGPNVWLVIHAVRRCLSSSNYPTAREELTRTLQQGTGLSPAAPLFERVAHMHQVQEEAIRHLARAESMAGDDGFASLELTMFYHDLRRLKRAEQRARALLRTPASQIRDEVKIRAHRVLAGVLETGALGDEQRLREAATHWAHFLIGLKDLALTNHERNIARHAGLDARGRIGVAMQDAQICHEVATSLLDEDETNSTGLFYRGMAHYFDQNLKEAESDLLTSLNKRTDFTAHMTLGKILAKLGGEQKNEGAINNFRMAAKIKPNSFEPKLEEARLNAREGYYRDAKDRLDELIKERSWVERLPDSAFELRDEVELALLKRDKNAEFESPAQAKRALQIDARDRYALYYLARHYLDKGQLDAALDYARRLNAAARRRMLSYLLLIEVYIARREYEEAEEVLVETDELDPHDSRPIVLAAKLAELQHQGAKHWRLMMRAIDLDPRNWELRHRVARLIFQSGGAIDGARHHLDIAMRNVANPPYGMLRLDVELRLRAGQPEEAAIALERLRTHPKAPLGDLVYFRGRMAEMQDNIPSAVSIYEEGLRDNPNRGDIIVRLARLYEKQNDRAAALDQLARYYSRGGRHPEAAAMLAEYHIRDWNLEKAKEVYGRFRKIAPNDLRAQIGVGSVALHLDEATTSHLMDMLRPYFSGRLQAEPDPVERTVDLLLATSYGFLKNGNWRVAVARLRELETVFRDSPLRNQALLAYFKGDRPYTRYLVERGLREKPSAHVLRFLRGLMNLRDGDITNVLSDVHTLTPDIEPGAPWAEYADAVARKRPGFGRLILAATGETLLLEGRVQAADEVLRVASKAFPRDPEIALLLGHVRRRQGDDEGALDAFKRGRAAGGERGLRDEGITRALKKDAASLELLEGYAKMHPRIGSLLLTWARFEVGGEHLTEVLRTLRTSTHWHWDLTDDVLLAGLAYIVDGPEGALGQIPGKQSLAGPLLQELLTREPVADLRFADLWRNLVRGIVLGNVPLFHHAALRHLESARAVDPAHPLFVDLVARQRVRSGDLEGAAELYEQLPESAEALRLLGEARLAALDPTTTEAAIGLFGGVIAAKRATSEAYRGLAELLIGQNKPKAAANMLGIAVHVVAKPVDPMLHGYRGIALEMLKDYRGAQESYSRALSLDPDNVLLAYRATHMLLRNNKFFEAIKIYQDQPAIRRDFPDIGLSLGLSLYNFGQQRIAAEFLREYPYSPQAEYCLGLIAKAADDEQNAIQHFEMAFNLDPGGQAKALLRAVELYRAQFKFREALPLVKRLLKRHPDHAEAWTLQADLLERMLRPDEALFSLTQAIRLDPNDPKPLLEVCGILREKGEIEAALRMLRRLETQFPNLPDEIREGVRRERLLLGR